VAARRPGRYGRGMTPASRNAPSGDDEPPYGAMAHVMKDHLYILERGHLFTTPCIAARVSLRFYVTIELSANGAMVEIDSGGGEVQRGPAMVFRPAHPRFVRARDAQLVAALLNPLDPEFPRFRSIAPERSLLLPYDAFAPLHGELVRAYRGELDSLGAVQLHQQIVALAAAQLPQIEPLDARVQEAASRARCDPELSISALAEELGLSPSRLSHLFTSQMGLPLRAYLLWAKVHSTAKLIAQGLRLTEITHMAGFADQAHMRRVFFDLFGAPPTHFLRNDNVVVKLGGV
jgi:AraC family transcriptional regulator, arabinose operon regulatory protein